MISEVNLGGKKTKSSNDVFNQKLVLQFHSLLSPNQASINSLSVTGFLAIVRSFIGLNVVRKR